MKRLLLLIMSSVLLVLVGCGVTSSPPPPPPAATHLGITTPLLVSTAGSTFSFTVSALDASGTVVTGYSGTVHVTSSDPQAQLPPDAGLANGTFMFQVTFKTAGSQTIAASDPAKSLASSSSNAINVSAGPATNLTVSAPTPVTTGFAFSVTVTASDAFGNQAVNYSGAVHLASSDAQAVLPPDATLNTGAWQFSPVTLKTIAPQTITATDTVTTSIKGVSNSINVVSNATTHLSMSSPASTNTRATFSVTVQALDAASNVSAGYAGTVHFTSSDSGARLPADSTLTAGAKIFPITLESAGSGTQTVTATDAANSSFTSMSSLSVSAPPLAINSATPPSGKVGAVYGRIETLHFRCAFGYPPGRVVCTLCNTTPTNTCGSYPPCTFPRHYPCIETTHPFVGFRFTGTGGVPPYNTWKVAGLPAGVTVDPNTGEILGTPTSPGTYPLTVTMTDSGLPTASLNPPASFSLTIALPDVPVVSAAPPPPEVVNQPYSHTFTGTGYPPLTWNESGALPTGLMFDDNTGTLSGTPTQTGSFTITVTATDQFKQFSTATDNFTIVVTAHGFIATGSMGTARRFHTATLLGSGKVLVAGGEDGASNAFASAELYDPSTGTFTPTKGTMTVARVGHTATLLNNGKVLLTGGTSTFSEAAVSTAELYDPATDTFTATTGSMTAARASHTATLLNDGTVLVAGGDVIFFNGVGNTSIMSLSSAEIFNPNTGTFTATAGSMTVPRESHAAALLSSGKVLITGGSGGALGNNLPAVTVYATSELYDPSTGHFTAAGSMSAARDFFTATLLNSGKVLVASGVNTTTFLQSADLYDPSSTSFAATGNLMAPRFYQDATLLNDGTVLVTGGNGTTGVLATAEVYDPTARTFATTGSMLRGRVWHTATLLKNGKVLVTGGGEPPLATCELYE